jgi:hypothetical protein
VQNYCAAPTVDWLEHRDSTDPLPIAIAIKLTCPLVKYDEPPGGVALSNGCRAAKPVIAPLGRAKVAIFAGLIINVRPY